jgi:type VI secretion system protein ImpA
MAETDTAVTNPVDIDPRSLFKLQDAEQPCGNNLEYDPQFQILETSLLGKPEVQYGESITKAEPPDWKAVFSTAIELMERTRDLRVGMAFTRASIHLSGFQGFASGIELIEDWLANQWTWVHPQADPDDDLDTTARINVLATLCDHTTVLRELRAIPIIEVARVGKLTVHEIESSLLDVASGEKTVLELSEKIDGIFAGAEISQIESTQLMLASAHDCIVRIEAIITRKVSAAQSIDFTPLTRLLTHLATFFKTQFESRVGDRSEQFPDPIAGQDIQGPSSKSEGVIASRQDVARVLDRVCKFYERNEPSSPVPLLIQRAKRLIDKSFIEILQDCAPDGLGQARNIAGVEKP